MSLFSSAMHRAARHGGLHVLKVYYRRLGAATASALLPGLGCRRLDKAELLGLCADPELDLREEMVIDSLSRGCVCVAAFVGEALAGYAWFACRDAPHLQGVRVRVPEHALYRFKAFVRPLWRGRGVAPFLYSAADALVAAPGRRYVVNCIAVQNRPSIAAALRSGDQPLGHLGYWQAGGRFLALHGRAVELFGLRFYLDG